MGEIETKFVFKYKYHEHHQGCYRESEVMLNLPQSIVNGQTSYINAGHEMPAETRHKDVPQYHCKHWKGIYHID